ncbi:MAG: hypothetical protein NTX64_04200 [Elusimicrobia bacterium]|nr:hypothetical protein [Elusimicrobiota bacterium]
MGNGIEFAVRAAMGNISDPKIRKLAKNSAADTEKAIQALIERQRAKDLTPFESERIALRNTLGGDPALEGRTQARPVIGCRRQPPTERFRGSP